MTNSKNIEIDTIIVGTRKTWQEKITFEERDKLKENYYEIANFEHNNTVGPKSISKQEFIKVFNKLF